MVDYRFPFNRLLKKAQGGARPGRIQPKSAVYRAIHAHFEPDFSAVSRCMRLFQEPVNPWLPQTDRPLQPGDNRRCRASITLPALARLSKTLPQRLWRPLHRFLPTAVTGLLILSLSATATAQDIDEPPSMDEQIIKPEVERREIIVPEVDTENVELGIFAGLYSLEDFGSNTLYGTRIAYHITEDVFFEAAFGASTVSDSGFRRIGLAIFPSENETLSFYHLTIGYNMLPGELYWWDTHAFTSALYLVGGVGNTHFVGENHFTFNFGLGLRLLLTDIVSLRFEIRDHVFDIDILGENKDSHNMEGTVGLAVFY